MYEEISDLKLHYETVGEGKSVLILHGGYGDYRQAMDEMEPAFAGQEGWKRIYVDLPAHGQSNSPKSHIRYDKVLESLIEFAERISLGERYAAAGMSAGGHLVRGFAHKVPERLLGAMFNATSFVPDPKERTLPEPATFSEAEGFEEMAGDALGMLRYIFPVRGQAHADWHRGVFTPARKLLSEEDALKSWEPENYAFSFHPEKDGEPFEEPSLIVCGRQDAVVGYRDAYDLIEYYPRATFATLDSAGHMIAPAQRKIFNAMVVDWLERMEVKIANS